MSTNDHRAGVREINLVNRTLKLNTESVKKFAKRLTKSIAWLVLIALPMTLSVTCYW